MAFLLSFGADSIVFQFASQKYKDSNIRSIILPVVLYGCEAMSLTSLGERRLRVLENRAKERET
jgi:hypothetical protein